MSTRITVAISMGITAIVAGCGSSARYINITEKAPIAIVSFSLDNSIVEEGKEQDKGPGILQKRENYYKHHQAAVDGLWRDFLENYSGVLLGAKVIDPQTALSNEQYRELTKHVPKMVMGVDIAPGQNMLNPSSGPNYVSPYNKEKMEKIAMLLGARLLMCIENKGSYTLNTGIQVGNIGAGAAKMELSQTIYLYEPGNGIVSTESFSSQSEESFAMVGGFLLSDNYEKGLCSAQKKLFPDIKSYYQNQKTKAEISASNGR